MMFGGPYNYNRKKSFKISYSHSSADQNTFYIYWFVVKLLNVMINQIQFNEFKGGLKSWEADNQIYILFTERSGPMAGVRGRAYQCGSLEAAFTLSGLFYFLH